LLAGCACWLAALAGWLRLLAGCAGWLAALAGWLRLLGGWLQRVAWETLGEFSHTTKRTWPLSEAAPELFLLSEGARRLPGVAWENSPTPLSLQKDIILGLNGVDIARHVKSPSIPLRV